MDEDHIRQARLRALGLLADQPVADAVEPSNEEQQGEAVQEEPSPVPDANQPDPPAVEVVSSGNRMNEIQGIVSNFFGSNNRSIMPIVLVLSPPPQLNVPLLQQLMQSPQSAQCNAPSLQVLAQTASSMNPVTVEPTAPTVPLATAVTPVPAPSASVDLTTPPVSPPPMSDRDWLRPLFQRSPTPDYLSNWAGAGRSCSRSPRRPSEAAGSASRRSRSQSPRRHGAGNALRRSRSRSPRWNNNSASSQSRSPKRNVRHRSPVPGQFREKTGCSGGSWLVRSRSRSRSPKTSARHVSPVAGPSRERSFHRSPVAGPSREQSFHRSPVAGPSRERAFHRSPVAGPSRERSVSPLSDEAAVAEPARPAPKRRGRPPGSKSKKNKTKTSEDRPRCSVCLDDKGPFVSTSCGHICHEKCLKKWMKAKKEEFEYRKTCPFCGKKYTQYFPIYY